MKTRGFVSGDTLSTGCTITRLCELKRKIDMLIRMVGKLDGLRGFGSNVLANVVGDLMIRR